MLEENFLHLARVNVEAAGDDQVLLAVHDVVVSRLVAPGDVAGVEPAVAKHLRRFSGLVPITLHHLRAADGDFTRFAHGQLARAGLEIDNADLGVGNREANAACFGLAVRRVDVRDGRSFRQAVTLDEPAAGELLELPHDFDRQCRAAAHADAERFEVVALDVRRVVEGDVHGRHAVEQGRPIFADDVQRAAQLEARQDNHRAAREHRGDHHARHRVDVEQGQGGDHYFRPVFAAGQPLLGLIGVADEVGVSEHRAFGSAGGAAGVLEAGDVGRRNGNGPR